MILVFLISAALTIAENLYQFDQCWSKSMMKKVQEEEFIQNTFHSFI